jgi:hypothetical protein
MALNARKAKLFTSVIDDGNAFGSAVTADDIRGLLADLRADRRRTPDLMCGRSG